MGGRRERVVFWSTAALLVVGAAVAYRMLLGPAPGAPREASPAAPPPPALRLTVAGVSGEVGIVRGGVRARAAVGDELRADDTIETATAARVTLASDGYEVALEEGAAF